MKIIQLAVTEGEVFALTDTGHVFRLGGNADLGWRWSDLPILPEQLPAPQDDSQPGLISRVQDALAEAISKTNGAHPKPED